MTLMYYVGGGQYLCWAHLIALAKGAKIPAEILATETCGVPNAN